MANFDFLKKIDKDLYEIISEAEKLYASEFFEQCMGQTRRFGEQMCKSVVGARLYDESFDEMLATLKDKAVSIPEKEFVDDLYFLKKQGNISVHSAKVNKDGILALECLQRAFEAAINYAVFYKKANRSILKKQYDIEFLVTREPSLKENYTELKTEKKQNKKQTKNSVKQSYTMKPKEKSDKRGVSLFWIFVGISSFVSAILMLVIMII